MARPSMTSRKQGVPICEIELDARYIVAIYQGSYGQNPELDFRVAYREYINNKWSRIRQPKHIHWAIDLLVERINNKKLTAKFVQHMITLYENIQPLKNKKEQKDILNNINFETLGEFKKMSNGFYTIKFVYCIMYLLIVEEKTSSATAHMFKNLLEKIKNQDDFYGIVNTATHNGKK